MRLFCLLIILFLLTGSAVQAQQKPCSDFLVEANRLYESGKFSEAVQKIESCINNDDVTQQELEVGYQLLAKSYVQLNENDKAIEVMHELLRTNPRLWYTGITGGSYINSLMRNFVVREKLSLGVYGGALFSRQQVSGSYSPINTELTNETLSGVSGGMSFRYNLRNNFSFTVQPGISFNQYRNTMFDEYSRESVFVEQMNLVDLPVDIGYKMHTNLFDLSLYAGLQFKYLLNSFSDYKSTEPVVGYYIHQSTETTDYRNRMLGGFRVGLGLSGGFLPEGLSLHFYREQIFTNLTYVEKRYANHEFIGITNYIDPDFQLIIWRVQASFMLPIKYYVDRK